MNLKIFVLIFVSFELASAKKYEICEFAKEAFVKYHVPRDEIFRHICIAQPSLDTSSDGTLVKKIIDLIFRKFKDLSLKYLRSGSTRSVSSGGVARMRRRAGATLNARS